MFIFDLLRNALDFVLTAFREMFSILSLTRQLADLVSHFLRLFGF